MEQGHHTSNHQHIRHTTHDLLHFFATVHAVQRYTRPCPSRAVLSWLYTTAYASSSSTQRSFIVADWSKFPLTLKVSQQQTLAAITDDFSSKPGALSPARNKRYRPCFEYPVPKRVHTVVGKSFYNQQPSTASTKSLLFKIFTSWNTAFFRTPIFTILLDIKGLPPSWCQ